MFIGLIGEEMILINNVYRLINLQGHILTDLIIIHEEFLTHRLSIQYELVL